MTINEFLEELKKHGIKFKVVSSYYIRDEEGLCPICALVKAKGLIENPSNAEARIYAQNLLNLTDSKISCIICTTDGFPSNVSYDPELRERLINDCCTIS